MYQNIYFDRFTREMHLWDDELGYNKFPYQRYAYKLDPNGLYTTIDDQRVSKVKHFTDSEVKTGLIYEADINAETRILVDLYKDSDEPSVGCNIGFWDIETEIGQGFPDWKNPTNKITAVAFFDKTQNQHYVFILDTTQSLEYRAYDNVKIIPCVTEEELIKRFLTTYVDAGIHILTDWNGAGFDIPYFYSRAVRVVGEFWANKLSPIGQVHYNDNLQIFQVAGLAHLDYLLLYKKFATGDRASYRLGEIGKLEVGIDKIKYEGTLDTLYRDDIDKFIQYNLNDNYIIEALEKKLKYIDITRSISHKCHSAYQDIFSQTKILDAAILTYAKRKDLVVPTKPNTINGIPEGEHQKAEGAFVKDPVTGRYRYLVDFDATSLYPSIIRTLNISPETKLFNVLGSQGYSINDLADEKVYDIKMADGTIKQSTGSKIKSAIRNNNLSFSCNSTAYTQHKRGIIPEILDVWFAERQEYSTLATKYGKEKNQELYDYYDRRQHLQKILINSLYGVLLQPSFRYYDKENGESVTRTGKRILLHGEKTGNKYVRDILNTEDVYVVYCDTDSLFIKLEDLLTYYKVDYADEEAVNKKILEIVADMQPYINKSFDIFCKDEMNLDRHDIHFKQEYIMKSGIFVAKKRYATWQTNKKGINIDKIDIKGIDVVKSNFAPAFRTALSKVLNDILYFVDKTDIENYLRKFKNEINAQHVYEIAKPSSLKDIQKYVVDDYETRRMKKATPVHVKAAIRYNWYLIENKLTLQYPLLVNGDKVKWVYLQNNPIGFESIALRGFEDPPELIEYADEYKDSRKIFESNFITKIQSLYDTLDWGTVNLNKNKNKFFK